MSEDVSEEVVEESYLAMSDEEVANIDVSALESAVEAPETVSEETSEEVDTDVEDEVEDGPEEATEDTSEESEDEISEEGESDEPEEESAELDYKAEYEKLLAPFKANGKEMKVESIDDAVTLMKMGANYNKKMAGLKPNLKLMKMLDNNGLLDEDKLSFLIDLDKKNPDAIARLLKEGGIDPLDVNTESATEYKPNTYNVDDKEVELDEVLEELKDSPTYHDTVDIIGNKWDEASKQVLVSNPGIIRVINDHVADGTYEQITKVMERERILGRLNGVSDIAAYKQIGDQLYAQGKFNKPQANTVVKPAVKAKDDTQLKSRKRAASSTKATPPTKKADTNFNPLSMSDEEFDNIALSKYM